jgi:hypothetical protein
MSNEVIELTRKPKDWGYEAQQAAEAHLAVCAEWMDYYEEGENAEPPEGEDPSCAPYDGCDTCLVREVLHAAWPIIEKAVRSGDLDDVEAGT